MFAPTRDIGNKFMEKEKAGEPKPGWSSAKISTPAFDEPSLLLHRPGGKSIGRSNRGDLRLNARKENEAGASSALVRPSFGVPELVLSSC